MSFMFNKTKVVSCPRSWDEYLEAASKLCPQIDGEYNYICIPNENKTELVQFCFRSGKFPAWQLAEHCPYLHNTGNMNSENCTSFSYGCPRKHYMTREIYKYPACLELNSARGCYIADSKCIDKNCKPCTPGVSQEEAEDVVSLALSVVFGTMTFCLLISLLLLYFVNRRRKGENRKRKYEDINLHATENENLLRKSLEMDAKPNVPYHERGYMYILEETSARITDIKDESNTKVSTLNAACKNGKTDACRYIINRYPDMLNQVDDEGWNATLYAAQGGNVEILELLQEKGVNMIYENKFGKNILHIACVNSRLEMCQYIVQRYPDILKQVDNFEGFNAALYAAQGGNVEILELLAEKGVDLLYKDKFGRNILHIACVHSQLEMCQHIVQRYPDMLIQVNNEGQNAALYAAQGGNVEILELLAGKGVDMTYKNKFGSNILHIACVNSQLDMCWRIIQHYPDILKQVDISEGWNAAFYAAKGGNVIILELLADKDVNLMYKDKLCRNILDIACVFSRLEMCQHIVQHYPDLLNKVDNGGNNAACYAATGGNVKILKLLAEKGADMTYKNKHGMNILHFACRFSNLEMCQHIIHHYPDMLNQVGYKGLSAVLSCAQGGNVRILKLLARKGVDLSYKDKFGRNILHLACVNSRLEMCQHIVQHYPDLLKQMANYEWWNVAFYAAQGGNVEILKLLAEKGVDLSYKDKFGRNILHLACVHSRLEMCQHIVQHYPDLLKQIDNYEGWNVALYAAQGGDVEILKLLAEKGVDMTYKSKFDRNILHTACLHSKLEMCEHIVQHYPDLLKQVTKEGNNAACYASMGGTVEILELLAEKGVGMRYKNKFGINILHYACMYSKLEICQYIIKHYPEMIHQVGDEGCNTALCCAKGGNVIILELLAKKGVDLLYKDKLGRNILQIACMFSRLEMCQYIVQRYPDMLKQVDNDEGWNAAFYAAQGGNVEILKLMADKGIDMTNNIKLGRNILHIACVSSRLEMCQHIVQHYPDMLNQVDNEGWNAALYAAQGGNVEIIELLAENGVDLTHKNKHGFNIYHIACMNSKLEMWQHIMQHYPDMLIQLNNDG